MGLVACQFGKARMRQKMFSNGGGFGFNVSFVDRASMFVESVFETVLHTILSSSLVEPVRSSHTLPVTPKHLMYMIQCNRCHLQYIGET